MEPARSRRPSAPRISRTADRRSTVRRSPPAPASRTIAGKSGRTERSGPLDGERCERGVDAWDQYAWVWDAAFYGLLGLTAGLTLLDPATAGDRWAVAGLT